MNSAYDLIIIGAGIHGAAIARHAALDGYKVCVIEQYEAPATATSCRSSKLIHGGLRYLESIQFKLVRECLAERQILLETAPSLVRLSPFYIPVYKTSKRPPWVIQLGLWLYRLLGGGQFRKIPSSEWHSLDGLNTHDLVSVFQYFDGVTDDRKLTTAVLDSAISLGAVFKSSHKVISCQLSRDQVRVEFQHQQALTAKLLVNAAGPWVNHILTLTIPAQTMANIELVQGTHIVIPRQLQKGVYYFEASDRRVIFAIPWQDQCLLGTTETPYSGDPAEVKPLAHEIEYLLTTWNRTFNDKLTASDVVESFAGLRVLPGSEGAVFNRSRDTEIRLDDPENPRIISIIGGKLTAHRLTAERTMKIIHSHLPGHDINSTRKRLLSE